ncbi:hypothetical protein CHS0354_026710 [Potamilus streckersoni]|uniref:Uncharacterized protein n=1 Tax=Potamilus streckersoni TaxID=2493646 RepID=A0AAE0S834_9BIVA|nr:hypothetical protein CHS0354_026710 [Potamilus streckersoni]
MYFFLLFVAVGAQKQTRVELTTTTNTHLPTQFGMISNTPSSSVTTMAHTASSSTTVLTKHSSPSTTDSVTIAPPVDTTTLKATTLLPPSTTDSVTIAHPVDTSTLKATTLLPQSTTDSVTIAPPMGTSTLKSNNLVAMTQHTTGATSAPTTFYAITQPTTQPSPTTTSPFPASTTLVVITKPTTHPEPTTTTITTTSASSAPTTFYAITQPTTQHQTTAALRRCFSCQDPVCSTQVLKTCPADSLYCMSSVDQIVSGLRIFSKGCAKEDTCIKKYWGRTSGNTDCFLNIDDSPSGPKNMKMSCDFCCTTDGCNEHAVPNSNTLYIKS